MHTLFSLNSLHHHICGDARKQQRQAENIRMSNSFIHFFHSYFLCAYSEPGTMLEQGHSGEWRKEDSCPRGDCGLADVQTCKRMTTLEYTGTLMGSEQAAKGAPRRDTKLKWEGSGKASYRTWYLSQDLKSARWHLPRRAEESCKHRREYAQNLQASKKEPETAWELNKDPYDWKAECKV